METANPTPRRLYKSRRNRMIDGVCGGVAEYFDFDPTIVRILWVLLSLSGAGIILYIAAMIIMPVNPDYTAATTNVAPNGSRLDKRRFWGVVIMLVGAFLLLNNLSLMPRFWWWSMSGKMVFSVLLIVAGVILIYAHSRRSEIAQGPADANEPQRAPTPPSRGELRRSIKDRKVFGVCGGIARYMNVDSTIVRILFLILVIASFGWGVLLYIILALLMPEEKPSTIL